MTTPEAIIQLVRDSGIDWQKTPCEHVTKSGKCKAVVSGFPGKYFWKARKRDSMREAMRRAGAWLVKRGKGQWEILFALTDERAEVLSSLWGDSFHWTNPNPF